MEQQDLASNKVKESLLVSFLESYSKVIEFMNKLPLDKKLKENSFLNFDQGALWAKEAILAIKLADPKTEDTSVTVDESATINESVPVESV